MRVNIFKAARRIAIAFCVVWIGGCAAYGIFAKPYAHLNYSISSPDAAPVRVERCGREDGSRYIATRDSEGAAVGVLLCFKTLKAKDAQWWIGGAYAPEVARQMIELEERFQLPRQGDEEARSIRREQRIDHWTYAAIAAASGLALCLVVVVGAGWVARSVLGLARGEDYLISWPPGASRGRRRSRTHAEVSSGRVGRRSRSRPSRLE